MSKYEILEVIDSGKIIDNNFNKYKGELKLFLEQMEEKIDDLPTVDYSGGIFGWGDHKVTGWEFNNLTEKIQGHFIVINDVSNKIIKENIPVSEIEKMVKLEKRASKNRIFNNNLLVNSDILEIEKKIKKELNVNVKILNNKNKKIIFFFISYSLTLK